MYMKEIDVFEKSSIVDYDRMTTFSKLLMNYVVDVLPQFVRYDGWKRPQEMLQRFAFKF